MCFHKVRIQSQIHLDIPTIFAFHSQKQTAQHNFHLLDKKILIWFSCGHGDAPIRAEKCGGVDRL